MRKEDTDRAMIPAELPETEREEIIRQVRTVRELFTYPVGDPDPMDYKMVDGAWQYIPGWWKDIPKEPIQKGGRKRVKKRKAV